ncbi:MAG: M48 family metallopeptidase, partial [Giesbergeria sp.]
MVFRHPQARRELRLGDAVVGYALVRARRRSIGFSVGAEGLSVRAPHAVTLGAIDAAVQEKSDWIVRKLGEMRERAARQDQVRIVWRDGVCLPWLGQMLCVRLDGAAPVGGRLLAEGAGTPVLQLGLPESATPQQMRDAVAAWLARSARAHFTQRLDDFAPRMGVRWQRLALTNARTRWGSARSDGTIRLNWRLMHFAPELLDYVVVHELAHLHHMDHSPRFWAEVAAILPDHAHLRRRLQQEPAPRWEDD